MIAFLDKLKALVDRLFSHGAIETTLKGLGIVFMSLMLPGVKGCRPGPHGCVPPPTAAAGELVLAFRNRSGQVPVIVSILVNDEPCFLDPLGRIRLPKIDLCKVKCYGRRGRQFMLRCGGMAAAKPLLELDTRDVTVIRIVCE